MGILDLYKHKMTFRSSSGLANKIRRRANQMRKLAKKEQEKAGEIKSIAQNIEKSIDTKKSEELAKHLEKVTLGVDNLTAKIEIAAANYRKHLNMFSDNITKGEQLLHKELEKTKNLIKGINNLEENGMVTGPLANDIRESFSGLIEYISEATKKLRDSAVMHAKGIRPVGRRVKGEKGVYKEMRKEGKDLKGLVSDSEALEKELLEMFKRGKVRDNIHEFINEIIEFVKQVVDKVVEEENNLKVQLFRFTDNVKKDIGIIDFLISKFESSIKMRIKEGLLEKYNSILDKLKVARRSISLIIDEIKDLLDSVRIQAKSEAKEAVMDGQEFDKAA